MDKMVAMHVMSKDVKVFNEKESVGYIVDTLLSCPHNGFPVVYRPKDIHHAPVLRGLILRSQLLYMIEQQAWKRPSGFTYSNESFLMWRGNSIDEVVELSPLTELDRIATIDLAPYMNRSPFSVHHDFHLSYAFRLFRSMALRHLPVVDDFNQVVGIITRKDLMEVICDKKYHDLTNDVDSGGLV
jgi:chloride channel 7